MTVAEPTLVAVELARLGYVTLEGAFQPTSVGASIAANVVKLPELLCKQPPNAS